ncbi:MAG TPA: hypothetical protein VHA77_09690 [Xanthobacteraceae bacterium]|nr:hypothetical protein [Xanthobacteraceae bacterium]
MVRRSSNGREVSEDLAEIERLMRDLEGRIVHLTQTTARASAEGASNLASQAGEAVTDALGNMIERLRDGARTMSDETARYARSFGDGPGKLGAQALHRVSEEVENRPLLLIAIAAGLGFLAGFAGRRS